MEKEETKEACLSFLKGKKFECVDKQLNDTKSSKQQGDDGKSALVCGRSPHLSTFAILLASSTKTECADTPYFWVAIGLLIGVCVVGVVVCVGYWIYTRRRNQRLEKKLKSFPHTRK